MTRMAGVAVVGSKLQVYVADMFKKLSAVCMCAVFCVVYSRR